MQKGSRIAAYPGLRRWMGVAFLSLVCGTCASGQAAPGNTPAPGTEQAAQPHLAAPAKVAGPVVEATPAIWKVQGAHETVYLFGTVHVMKPNVHWQTPVVMDAFRKSGTLYLEIADVTDTAAVQPLIMKYGMDMAHPLSGKISKDDTARLDEAAKSMGMPGEQMFEPMQPWLVTMTLSVLPMLKSGYAADSGIDAVLLGDAKQDGKKVEGLETAEQQVHLLADFPLEQQVAMLHEELGQLPDSQSRTEETVTDWVHGDVDKIASVEDGDLRAKHPELYKRLVVERNTRWADELAKLLASDTPGTVFVAVGAAHLAGPDSVEKLLEAKGFKVVRQ